MNEKTVEDWLIVFPELEKYTQNKYYKIISCLVLGVELIKLPRINEYRPYFVLYSLFGNRIGSDLKSCLSNPMLIKEFFNKKRMQLSINQKYNEGDLKEILQTVKRQLPFSMEGDVKFKDVMNTIDKYSKDAPLNASFNSFLQASLLERKLEISLFEKKQKSIDEILSNIKKTKWDLEHFKLCNIDYEEWINSIETKIKNQDLLIQNVKKMKDNNKLSKLHESYIF